MRKLRCESVRAIARLRRETGGYSSPRVAAALIGATALALASIAALASLVLLPAPSRALSAGSRHARTPTLAGGEGPTVPPGARAVPSLWTATSRTYSRPLGPFMTIIYPHVVNERSANGSWRPLARRSRTAAKSSGVKTYDLVGTEKASDCALASNSPTTSLCSLSTDTVGYDGTNTDNTLLKFPLTALPGDSRVLNAQLGMYLTSASTSNAVSVSAYAVAKERPWTSSATWDTYDGTHAWTAPGGDFSSTNAVANPSVTTPVGWKYWYPTQIVQEWVDETLPNDGFLLADTTQKQTTDLLTFDSSKASADQPFLTISWVHRGQDQEPRYTMQPFRLTDRSLMKVNLASGNLFVTSSDLTVKGTDMPFIAEHSWDSIGNESHTINPWTPYTIGGEDFEDGSITLRLPNYEWMPFIKQPNGTFATPPGINATLCTIDEKTCKRNAGDPESAIYALKFNTSGEGPWYQAGNNLTLGETGGLLSIADRYGNKLVYHYCCSENGFTDTQGRKFKRKTEELGGKTLTTGWLEETDGREVKYGYNGSDLLSSYTDALGHETKYAYDEEDELKEITDPKGNVTKLNYDTERRITKITLPEVGGKHPVWEYGYFPATDTEHGHECTELSTNKAVHKTVVTDPNSHQSTFCSNVEDEVVQSFDAAGNKTSAAFNALGERTTSTAAAPGSGEKGNVESLIYENEGEAQGRLSCAVTGTETEQSKCPKEAGGSMLVTNFHYANETNHFLPTRIENPEGKSTFACYDEEKQKEEGAPECPKSATGPKGALQNITDPLSSEKELSFEYNSNGTVKSSKDADGHTTSYEYDEHGNLKKITPASGTETGEKLEPTTIEVDSNSRPHVITDGEKHIETITYDKLDRPTEIAYTGTGTAKTVKFEYDADGNVAKREDSTGTTKYTVDALNRVTKEALPESLSNEYGYDAASNTTSFTDGGGSTKYAYNNLGELESVTEPGASKQTNFSYDGDHRLTKIVYPSEATELFKLEALTGRPESITFEHLSGTSVPNLTYEYKSGTNNTQLIQSLSESSGPKTTYKYDPLNRLESAVKESSGKEVESKYVFKLDGDGNRTEQVVKPKKTGSEETTYYVTNAGNLLECRQTVKPTEGKCSGSSSTELSHYKYDNAGEETEIIAKADTAGTTFAFNAAKELSSLTPSGSGAKSLSYGGTGQDDLVKLGTTSIQNSLLGLTREVASGTSYFARTPAGMLVDERTPSGNFNPLFDAQGDVIALVSTSGKVERTFQYGPYGENTESGGTQTIPDPFGYKGGYRTPGGNVGKGNVSNGLYHFGQRYYDPTTGRWTQRDPLSQIASPVQADRFLFAVSDPVNGGDPTGRSLESYGEAVGIGCAEGVVTTLPGNTDLPVAAAIAGCAGGGLVGGLLEGANELGITEALEF